MPRCTSLPHPASHGRLVGPQLKGKRLPTLAHVLHDATTGWTTVTVRGWYGEGERAAESRLPRRWGITPGRPPSHPLGAGGATLREGYTPSLAVHGRRWNPFSSWSGLSSAGAWK